MAKRSEDRRESLLRAAAEVFFEQGYAAASIDAIIERSGGSKRNIYAAFGNKEGLFAAIVTGNADRVLSTLEVEKIGGRDLRETLTTFGDRLMAAYMTPTLVGIFRMVVTEANRFPDLARDFYEKGPERAVARLAQVLDAARGRAEIQVPDSVQAAGHFVGMIRGNLHLQVVLGLRAPPSDAESRAAVRSAVDVFLLGVQGTGR